MKSEYILQRNDSVFIGLFQVLWGLIGSAVPVTWVISARICLTLTTTACTVPVYTAVPAMTVTLPPFVHPPFYCHSWDCFWWNYSVNRVSLTDIIYHLFQTKCDPGLLWKGKNINGDTYDFQHFNFKQLQHCWNFIYQENKECNLIR